MGRFVGIRFSLAGFVFGNFCLNNKRNSFLPPWEYAIEFPFNNHDRIIVVLAVRNQENFNNFKPPIETKSIAVPPAGDGITPRPNLIAEGVLRPIEKIVAGIQWSGFLSDDFVMLGYLPI